MMNPSEKGSDCKDQNKTQNQSFSDETKKTCVDCGTSKTPLWRGGPAGPKSLCNACGIRSRKKRREILGLNKGEDLKKSKKGNNNMSNSSSSNSSSNSSKKLRENLKKRLLALGREVLMQRSTVENRRTKLGEEEQAAVLLMALSYGSVYAEVSLFFFLALKNYHI